MKDYKEVFVGQIFKNEDEGPIKVLEIGTKLIDKYPDLCSSGAQHGLDEGIDVRWSQDGEESISDYIDFIDFTYSNCFEPNKKSPNGTGNMEPVYKREEDEEDIEASIPASLQKQLTPLEELRTSGYAEALADINAWPYTNTVGSCWCGHSKAGHMINEDDHCLTCQCMGFVLDRWVTTNG